MTDYIATHSKKQTFNVGSDGLFKRHDYDTEVVAGGPAAHYPRNTGSSAGSWSRSEGSSRHVIT